MNENDFSDKMEKENFENQIMQNKSEKIVTDGIETSPTQPIEYPSKRLAENKPKKSGRHIASLIISVIVIILIISTFFFSWYRIGMGISMFFIFPISADMDMNFHLTEINLDVSANWNESDMSQSVGYSELEEKAEEQEKANAQTLVNLFRNIGVFVIVLLIFSIIAFIGVLCTTFNFGNKNTMKKIGISFGILTFILGVFTAGYFMYEWDSDIINKGLPDLQEDDSSIENVDIIKTEEGKKELKNIGFWDSKNIGLSFSDINDSNMSFFSIEGDSDFDLYTFDLSFKPGLGWHILILLSILSLLSTIILFNKKILMLVIILFVCSIILFGFLFYMSINAEGEDSSSRSMFSFEDDSDPAEVSKFIGTWELDVNNTSGHNIYQNITEETWVFWENETFNNYRVSTKYEYGGSGSMSCSWVAKDNKITLCGESYNYVFSNDKTLVTLEKDDEKIVLNKTVG